MEQNVAKAKVFKEPQAPKYSVLNAKDEKLLEFSKQADGEIFYFAGNIGNNCCYVENNEIIYKKDDTCESIIKLSECPLIGEHNYQNLHLHADAEIVVNTTPVGMYPAVGESPV